MKLKIFLCTLAAILFSPLLSAAEKTDFSEYDRALSLRSRMSELVYRAEVKPQWLADGRFWYRVQTGPQTHEFILVNPETGVRQPAFDHEKLASSLAKTTGERMHADGLPLSGLDFSETNFFTFTANGKTWRCNLENYSLAPKTKSSAVDDSVRRLPAPLPVERLHAPPATRPVCISSTARRTT